MTADAQRVPSPTGVEVVWLPRDGAPLGSLLGPAVLAHLGASPAIEEPTEVEPDLWETPSYSSSGEPVEGPAAIPDQRDLYAWIAGESGVVTALRRALVGSWAWPAPGRLHGLPAPRRGGVGEVWSSVVDPVGEAWKPPGQPVPGRVPGQPRRGRAADALVDLLAGLVLDECVGVVHGGLLGSRCRWVLKVGAQTSVRRMSPLTVLARSSTWSALPGVRRRRAGCCGSRPRAWRGRSRRGRRRGCRRVRRRRPPWRSADRAGRCRSGGRRCRSSTRRRPAPRRP